MTTSPSRSQRRAAAKAAKATVSVDPAPASQPTIPADIDSYHQALVQRHGELSNHLQQLQAAVQQTVGQINQIVGEVRAVEQIKAMQAAGSKNEPPAAKAS